MTTLYDVILATAEALRRVRHSTATATGAVGKTTLIDTTRQEADDFFHRDLYSAGTIFFKSGDNASSFKKLTDYTQSTGTFTFGAVTAQTDTGDQYAVADITYPLDVMITGVNTALQNIPGVLEEYSLSTYVTVADQMDYDLPTGKSNIKRVEVASSQSAPYGYVPHYNWSEVDGQISFAEGHQPSLAGYRIRLTLQPPNSVVTDDSDDIPDHIHKYRLVWEAVPHILRTMPMTQEMQIHLTEALAERQHMALVHPTPVMNRDPRHSGW